MRIGIDIQTLTTYEGTRGIGRLCAGMVTALRDHCPENSYYLFGSAPEAPDCVAPLLGNGVTYCPIVLDGGVAEHLRIGCSAPFLWTTPAASELDLYHVTSPFMPDILLPIGGGVPVVATLLDAIPAVMREQRQPIMNAAGWEAYQVRRNVIAGYQHYLPISESAASDCARLLDLPEEDMTVTYVPIEQTPGRDISETEQARILSGYGLSPGYVISVTGYHARKNILGTLRAYACLPVSLRRMHPLVLVCALQQNERDHVVSEARRMGIDKDVFLTGFVSDRELTTLVRAAGVMIFASRYEGFGIPAAEAMALGVPVVASDASSLPEVVGAAGVTCDPEDAAAFGRALEALLGSDTLRRDLTARGFMQVARFSPDSFARRVVSGYENAIVRQHLNKAQRKVSVQVHQNLRVAVFSPLTPCMSGVADYTEQLLLHLGDLVRCDCYIEKYSPRHHLIRERFDCWEQSAFRARHATDPYDVILYQIGNNLLHGYTLPFAEKYPGVVVFHDFSLLGVHRILAQRFGERRAAQQRFCSQYPGVDPSCWEDDRLLHELSFTDYRMTEKVLATSQSVIVHSQWLAEEVRQFLGDSGTEKSVNLIPLGVSLGHAEIARPAQSELRRKYLVSPDAFVIVSVGGINRHKRVYEVLEAFESFHAACPDSCFLLVGHADRELRKRMGDYCAARGIKNCVRFLGRREIGEFYDILAMADICVNLRYPTMGESSATLMNIMAMGKPALVTPLGQFREFPDDVCWKVRPGAYERRELLEYFRFLKEHPEAGIQLGQRARTFVLGATWEKVARKYLSVLQAAAARK